MDKCIRIPPVFYTWHGNWHISARNKTFIMKKILLATIGVLLAFSAFALVPPVSESQHATAQSENSYQQTQHRRSKHRRRRHKHTTTTTTHKHMQS
jgi:hypothetical protein